MNPFEGRALSMRFIKIGVAFLMPGLIASVMNIDFWILNGAFMVGLAMLFIGLLIRIVFFRCPHCKAKLHAYATITEKCHRCGWPLAETQSE